MEPPAYFQDLVIVSVDDAVVGVAVVVDLIFAAVTLENCGENSFQKSILA